jgi:hypothetical protein
LSCQQAIEELVEIEIHRRLDCAAAEGIMVSTGDFVLTILQLYPSCGLTERDIADRIVRAAARRGIAIRIDGGRGKR